MRRVLITGLSGVGKSSVLERLAALGHRTVDTDLGPWLHEVPVEDAGGTTHEPMLVPELMDELLRTADGELLAVAATARNQGDFYDRFDAVVLLSAPVEVMAERLAHRSTNDYGKDATERAEALAYKETVEPLLRRRATLEIDTRTPLDEVVASILGHVGLGP
ncbi:AAA family ATPase [Luteipulveratus sp. YIM 133132]|uniref:AAA family ATPase n=1 Tax=Luteipulveratus flavus TaxID=3031728 RepID=UPI0023B01498|nr:AAA family ATPase [Luteipulveratus sp. YIM 133132]MDE9364337.1 AAA family ATPase [Luteipulveratus sp. YIM 133132]